MEKPERNRTIGRLMYKYEQNLNMNLRETDTSVWAGFTSKRIWTSGGVL
jgi:hypothetical protein